jgi:hypothetical protein
MAIAGFAILAPWWGTEPAPAPGQPLANALYPAYALPAALFALYAWLRARLGPSLRAYVAGGAATACGLVWLLLEVRRFFHPDAMAIGPIGGPEHAAYSLALAGASAAVLAAALQIGRGPGATALKVFAALLTAAAVLKALAVDIGFLDGPMRYGAYVLAAGAGVGAVLGYQRYIFPKSTADDAPPRADGANLLPP